MSAFADFSPIHARITASVNLDEVSLLADGSPSPIPIVSNGFIEYGSVADGAAAFGEARDGDLIPAIESDWYNRIHLIPDRFDLGNILQGESRDFLVWNSFFISKTLNAVVGTGDEGIALSGQPDPPLVYGPLEFRTLTVSVSLDGPVGIDASFLFDWSDAENVTLLITGTRSIVFAFEPQFPLEESLAWKTDILQSYGGFEQRVRVRPLPRQAMRMSVLLSDINLQQRLQNLLFSAGGRAVGVPVWWDLTPLLASAAPSDTLISVDTTASDFREGGFAILWRSATDFEAGQILSVNPGSLEFALPLADSHPAGTSVMPLQRAVFDNQIERERQSIDVARYGFLCRFLEVADLSLPDGQMTLFKGSPVFDDINFMSSNVLSEPIDAATVFIDNDIGAGPSPFRRRSPVFSSVKGWFTRGRAARWRLRRLLHAMRGRQRSFWLPTHREDFVLNQAIGPADTTIFVTQADFLLQVDGEPPFDHLAIRLTNGSVFYREITAVSVGLDPTNESLSIDSALGQAVSPSDVAQISLLLRCRFDSDEIALTHPHQEETEVFAPVVAVVQ